MNPFDAVADNPVWLAYKRQRDRDDTRIDLAELWRAAGRPRKFPSSPRRWARRRPERIAFEGKSADDPAWAGWQTALIYAEFLDPEIMRVGGECFIRAAAADPVGIILDAPDACRPLVAMFVASPEAVIAATVERTSELDIYAQETAVAKVQRAFLDAGSATVRLDDGECGL
jgi:hypothetical protein